MVEVLHLYPVDDNGPRRAFDAANDDGGWAGLVTYEAGWEPPRIYVFVDRADPLGDSYAVRTGQPEEIIDDASCTALIIKALTGMPTRPIGLWTAEGFQKFE